MNTTPYPKTRGMLKAEARLNEPLENYLRRELNQRRQSHIAKDLKVTPSTLQWWMMRLGIRRSFE